MLSDSDKEDKGRKGGGGDESGMSAAEKPAKRDKSQKPPKGDRKKQKSWKVGSQDEGAANDGEDKSQQPNGDGSRLSGAPAASGGENGGLKLNVNPTEREEGSVERAEDGKSPDPNASPSPKEERKDDGKAAVDDDDDGADGEDDSPPAFAPNMQMSKREMDRMLLTKETRDIKEKLLDYTNDIIVRQNGLDPIANFESFTVETAARKALKELLNEFTMTAEELKKKQVQNDEKIRNQKNQIEKLQVVQKKLQGQCQAVETFGKRLSTNENKIDIQREAAEKRHESIREHVGRIKEMLEARVDQVTQFGEKIANMQEEHVKMKKMNDDFREKLMKEVLEVKATAAKSEQDLKDFKERAQFFFDKMEFWSNHSNEEIRGISDQFEGLRVRMDGIVDEMRFDLDRRVKIEDMRQNFDRLNDILVVKFKQLEDTKQATRNLITYQKYYQPIETQQLISDNLMKLKAVKSDQNYMIHQKVLYETATESTRQACIAAQKIEDIDLKEHLADLNHKKLAKNDWDPFPLYDITEGSDFVARLMTRYLDDIRVRKKEAEFGIPPPSVLLRKTVKLSEIDRMIEIVQEKSIGIAMSAEEMAEKLAKEAKQKELEDTIRRLCKRRLEYQHRQTFKRRNSFKGRLQNPLFTPGAELQEFQDKMDEADLEERPKSRQHERQDRLRPLMKDCNIDFNTTGRNMMGSQLSQSQETEDIEETNQSGEGETADNQGENANMLDSIMSAMKTGNKVGPATGEGGGGMTELQKLAFKTEIKEEMRPICKEIADERTNRAIGYLREQTTKYQDANELDKKRLIDRLQKELLQVSELLKKQMLQVQTEVQDDIRNLHRLRARDKSDNDVVFTKHFNSIHDSRVDINKHENYFETLAQSISMITENINMQMEAEYADLLDRKMMALYGAQPGKASKADFTTKLDSKARQKAVRSGTSKSPGSDLENVSVDYLEGQRDQNKRSNVALTIQESQENVVLDENMNKIDSVLSMQRIISGSNIHEGAANNTDGKNFDDIRQTSGMPTKRRDLTIKFDQSCLSHQQQGHDTHLTLKMFKMACLAYQPSKINYREMLIDRTAMVEMRRSLIDKVSNLLPHCDLFKNNAIYPRRYYDDLMIDERGYQEHLHTIRSKAGFKADMMGKLTNLLNAGASSTNIGSDQRHSQALTHSPTGQMGLNKTNNLTLPDLNANIASKLPFGIGQKKGYDSMSDVQQYGISGQTAQAQSGLINRFKTRNQSMTLDIGGGVDGHDDDKQSFGYMAKSSLKGVNSTRNRGQFNNTDIKRNASMAVVNNLTAPKLFNSSRKNFMQNLNSTGPQDPNQYSESKSNLDRSPRVTQSEAKGANEFHKRNNSTIGDNFKGKLNIEIGGRGLQGLKSQRPSVQLPNASGGPLKPKVSFDLPANIRR